MHILKKILILVIVFVTIYIIHYLLKNRNTIKLKAQQELEKKRVEGFGEDEIQKVIKSNEPISITAVLDKFLDLPLRQFIVKSSYNSAISGTFANQEMIRILLQRGVRLLDFEIYTDNSIEYVSYSKDKDSEFTMSTVNEQSDRLSFANAVGTVNSYAFIMPSPSPNDPLFLLLRVKNDFKESDKKQVYKRIADILKTTFPNRLYQDSDGKAIDVNGSTPLKDIMGKIVIIFDTEGKIPNYLNYCADATNACSEIYPFINIPANIASGLPIYNYDDITTKYHERVLQKGDGFGTTINTFVMVAPPVDDIIQVPPPKEVINSSFPQFLLYKFYIQDANLAEYENIFNEANSSFVPISSFLITKGEPQKENTNSIKSAIPQKPAGPLGFSFKLW
jgi:hypothetical protein